jgi:hypothetical protein
MVEPVETPVILNVPGDGLETVAIDVFCENRRTQKSRPLQIAPHLRNRRRRESHRELHPAGPGQAVFMFPEQRFPFAFPCIPN